MPYLSALHVVRNLELDKYLPRVGGIVFYAGRPIAIGFVRQCEGNVGIWDGLITDPQAEPIERDKCLDALLIFLIRTMKSYGITRIISWAQDSNTIERAQKLGFKPIDATLMAGDF